MNMMSDEYYSNPINTANKCVHDIPMKHNCKECIDDKRLFELEHMTDHAMRGIEKCFDEIDNLRVNLMKLAELLDRTVTVIDKIK